MPNKAPNLPCNFLSLSEYPENWEKLSILKKEEKFLLPNNWELIYQLLLELKEAGKIDNIPIGEIPFQDPFLFREWKFKVKKSLLALLEIDFRSLLEKYNQTIFFHSSSRLSYKVIHPEEIKSKSKPMPTLSGVKNLNSFLNRKLNIFPLFFDSKNANLRIFESWKIESLKKETSFQYNEDLIKNWEEKDSDLFVLHSFKEPYLPILNS